MPGSIPVNYTVATAPPVPASQGDLWFDTVNSQLNVFNGTQFVPISSSTPPGTALNGSIATNYAGLLMVPAVAGSYGASVAFPSNQFGLAVDGSAGRIWIVGSGGVHKSVAVA